MTRSSPWLKKTSSEISTSVSPEAVPATRYWGERATKVEWWEYNFDRSD